MKQIALCAACALLALLVLYVLLRIQPGYHPPGWTVGAVLANAVIFNIIVVSASVGFGAFVGWLVGRAWRGVKPEIMRPMVHTGAAFGVVVAVAAVVLMLPVTMAIIM